MRIADELGVEHISSGDLLRAAVAEDTPLGREVADAHGRRPAGAGRGRHRRRSGPCSRARDGYVLDGFPRKLAQTGGLDFDAVVYLDVPAE